MYSEARYAGSPWQTTVSGKNRTGDVNDGCGACSDLSSRFALLFLQISSDSETMELGLRPDKADDVI